MYAPHSSLQMQLEWETVGDSRRQSETGGDSGRQFETVRDNRRQLETVRDTRRQSETVGETVRNSGRQWETMGFVSGAFCFLPDNSSHHKYPIANHLNQSAAAIIIILNKWDAEGRSGTQWDVVGRSDFVIKLVY